MAKKHALLRSLLAAAVVGLASCSFKPAPPVYPNAVTLDQGSNWTPESRGQFYSDDQGSRLIPLKWMQALKQPDGKPFANDSFARYGYLPNPPGPWPVGFATGKSDDTDYLGMTCAACHTRQITVGGVPYRIDGGPAIVLFQNFLSDLDAAVAAVATDGSAFAAFAQAVLGHTPTPAERAQLLSDVQAWFGPYHTLITRALPAKPWGPGRLDAVAMIFNRVTGLDIGTPERLIPENIHTADAPVRYPFLWNAPKQDKTQWPGFLDNGNDLLGLARNIGEVNGVFSQFRPVKKIGWPGIDYKNSINIDGLLSLEQQLKNLGPPKWPFAAIDPNLAARGATVFATAASGKQSCADCHAQTPGITRFFNQPTWTTAMWDVGSDTREYDVLKWTASTGILSGAKISILGITLLPVLKPVDTALNITGFSVVGSIVSNSNLLTASQGQFQATAGAIRGATSSPPSLTELRDSFARPRTHLQKLQLTGQPPQHVYESRVLYGIWAAAPYLHNGSVPTLADLLKPAATRPATFAVGPAYDVDQVGLASSQTVFNFQYTTTDCNDLHSGNSRCGHDFGTDLPEADKKALLEYLKSL